MRIAVITAAYNCFSEDLAKSMVSEKGHEVIPFIFVHSMDRRIKDGLEVAWDRNFVVANYGFNRGLSRSWNDGISAAIDLGCESIIITNDDIIFGRGDIDTLGEFAMEHRDLAHIAAFGYNEYHKQRMGAGFSCFALNPIAIHEAGYFDVNIWPAYYEDCDYSRRAGRLELQFGGCEDTNIWHLSSGTIRSDQELAGQNVGWMMATQQYYTRKWGGMPGEEKFDFPFNSSFGLRIDGNSRNRPYGPFDRDDYDWEWCERLTDEPWTNLHLY